MRMRRIVKAGIITLGLLLLGLGTLGPTQQASAQVCPLRGDCSNPCDDTVDISDLVMVGTNFGLSLPIGERPDLAPYPTGDGVISVADLVEVGAHFGNTNTELPFNIVVVGWDGTQRNHFFECYNRQLPECPDGLPNIQALQIFHTTITSGASETKPGWAQIFSGYNAEAMGIYNNGNYQPLPEGYSVFEKIENHFGPANVVTMFISGKGVHTGGACVGDPTTDNGQPVIEDQGQPWCLTKQHLDYYENDLRQNANVGNRALELLELHQNDFFFALFLFRSPDVQGHLSGENSIEYSQAIVDDDQWLGTIMNKLEELGIAQRTLVYVTTDHGFDEGLDRHGNAPYTFLASNDPLIIRGGDRKDITPTILERYNISTGAIGQAPAVDGHSLYSFPSMPCIPEGEAYLDYPGMPFCCPGLSLIGLDRQVGQSCVEPTGGQAENSGYCTYAGDGACDFRENICNVPEDCSY